MRPHSTIFYPGIYAAVGQIISMDTGCAGCWVSTGRSNGAVRRGKDRQAFFACGRIAGRNVDKSRQLLTSKNRCGAFEVGGFESFQAMATRRGGKKMKKKTRTKRRNPEKQNQNILMSSIDVTINSVSSPLYRDFRIIFFSSSSFSD